MVNKFQQALQEQVRNEFTAAQQYVALAVWFDGEDLPQLAKHFYRQSLEERGRGSGAGDDPGRGEPPLPADR